MTSDDTVGLLRYAAPAPVLAGLGWILYWATVLLWQKLYVGIARIKGRRLIPWSTGFAAWLAAGSILSTTLVFAGFGSVVAFVGKPDSGMLFAAVLAVPLFVFAVRRWPHRPGFGRYDPGLGIAIPDDRSNRAYFRVVCGIPTL